LIRDDARLAPEATVQNGGAGSVPFDADSGKRRDHAAFGKSTEDALGLVLPAGQEEDVGIGHGDDLGERASHHICEAVYFAEIAGIDDQLVNESCGLRTPQLVDHVGMTAVGDHSHAGVSGIAGGVQGPQAQI